VSARNKLPSIGAPVASVTFAEILLTCAETEKHDKSEMTRRRMNFMALD